LPRPIIKFHPKIGRDPELGELPEILGFPFNISGTVQDSDFKFGMQLGFAKVQHKITLKRKVGVALG